VAPDFCWDAFTLFKEGTQAGATITSWPNTGTAGSPYDAKAGAAGTVTYQETPAGLPYAAFAQSYFTLPGPGIDWKFSGGAGAGVTIIAVVAMQQQGGRFERIVEFCRPGCQHAIAMMRPERHNEFFFSAFEADAWDNCAAVRFMDAYSGGGGFQVFTGVCTATEARVYRDGKLMGSASGFPPRSDRTTTFNNLGLPGWGAGIDVPLTAQVQEISVWRRALGGEELAAAHRQLAEKWAIELAA
jgi:hypothetical protein